MDYDGLVSTLSNLLVVPATDTAFLAILPTMIADAEGRIYREEDFLATREVVATTSFTSGIRSYTLPTDMRVVQKINAITPAATTPDNGTRNPLQFVSYDMLDFIWPNASGAGSQGVPQYYALKNATTIVVAPTPDAAYTAEVSGTFQPEALSAANTSTYLSETYPDLLVAACMIFGSGWLQNWSAMADNSGQALSWEQHYQTQFKSAYEEEQRRKGQSVGWTPYSQTPLANPPRT